MLDNYYEKISKLYISSKYNNLHEYTLVTLLINANL
jgi:hypothetical protein